ncbi:hypothetical protein CFP56_013241, partial [Quercus suber]
LSLTIASDTFNSTSSSSALSSLSLTNSSYLPNLTHSSKATPRPPLQFPPIRCRPLSSSFSPSSSSSPTPLPPSSSPSRSLLRTRLSPFLLAILRLLHRRHRPDLRSPSQLRHHLRANLRSHLSPLSNPRLPAQALCCRCGTRGCFLLARPLGFANWVVSLR